MKDDDLISPDIVQKYKERFKRINGADADRYTKEALTWFRQRITKDRANQRRILDAREYWKKTGTERNQIIGKMYFFQYEAEQAGDAELGIYDEFPLVFIFNTSRSKQGKQLIHAINLHYIIPAERQVLLHELLKIRSSKRMRRNTRIKLTWDVIKAVSTAPIYERMVHTYRVDRMKSRLIEIPAQDWGIVVFLQLQRWVSLSSTPKSQSYYRRSMTTRGRRRIAKR